jgi:toxin ParE1/3/4
MMRFRLHPEAGEEGIEAAAYIKADDPYQGALFIAALEDALAWARKEPLVFGCFDGEFRKVKLGKFRYSLVFRLRGEEIQILAIMHTSRKPGYWKKRAQNWK